MTTPLVSPWRPTARSSRESIALTAAGLAAGALAGSAAGAGWCGVSVGCVAGVLAAHAGWADLRARRIPNRAVVAGFIATAVLAMVVGLGGDRAVGGSTLAGGVVAGGLLLVLHLARPASLGFGDVKLAAVLGALVGILHWSLAAVMLGLAAAAGAVGAAGLATWRRSIPFGACMGGAALTTIAAADLLRDRVGLW